jgi:ribosomal protein S28E/S33
VNEHDTLCLLERNHTTISGAFWSVSSSRTLSEQKPIQRSVTGGIRLEEIVVLSASEASEASAFINKNHTTTSGATYFI